MCEVCKEDTEGLVHALWGCVSVKEVWQEGEHFKAFISERFANFADHFVSILIATITILNSNNTEKIFSIPVPKK